MEIEYHEDYNILSQQLLSFIVARSFNGNFLFQQRLEDFARVNRSEIYLESFRDFATNQMPIRCSIIIVLFKYTVADSSNKTLDC